MVQFAEKLLDGYEIGTSNRAEQKAFLKSFSEAKVQISEDWARPLHSL